MTKINITRKIGNATIQAQVEQPESIEALFESAMFAGIPDHCTLCGSSEVTLESNKANSNGKTLLYVKIRCVSCSATSTLGQYMGTPGGFWKNFEIYKREEKEGGE